MDEANYKNKIKKSPKHYLSNASGKFQQSIYYNELYFASPNFACAAANRAIGTLGAEQET